jgi:hypothetical protein
MSTRERIIAEIKKCAEKLGRAPSQAEFRREAKISWHQVYKHFRGMRPAVRAAGLEPGPRGGPLNEQALVLDWARVVRELGRLPSRAEYDARGKHHSVTLHARIGWHQMGHRFVLLVREFHLETEWKDVLEIVGKKYPLLQHLPLRHRDTEEGRVAADWRRGTQMGASRESSSPRAAAPHGMRLGRVVVAALAIEILVAADRSIQQNLEPLRTLRNTEVEEHLEIEAEAQDDQRSAQARVPLSQQIQTAHLPEPPVPVPQAGPVVYGEPLGLAAMAHAPTCEDGVLFLFGVVATDLGFRVERIQKGFPDCEAKREVAPGRWERVWIEFELYSRNFKEHGHDPAKCHAIVCWKHNWPDVPEGLEVIELSRVVKGR